MQKIISEFISSNERPLIVLLGPTASGKTGASIELAKDFNGEIISADSRQVYRHMDIGTAKITLQERQGVPHHLLDVVDPDQRFTLNDFKSHAEKMIDEIFKKGKIPIMVGGTGLYIEAITQNFSLPPENPDVRAQLYKELEEVGAEELHARLAKVDPQSATKFHFNNSRYIIRALEVAMTTGSAKKDTTAPPKYDVIKVGYQWEREKLYKRINARAEEQIKNGLFEETAKLLKMGYDPSLPSMSSLGYRESIQYLNEELSREEALAAIQQNCRNYARKQLTWFKKDGKIRWTVKS